MRAELAEKEKARKGCEEQLRGREVEAGELRDKLFDTEQRLVAATTQLEQMTRTHAMEREELHREKEGGRTDGALAEAQTETSRLSRELDEIRRKFEGMKKLLV